MSALRQPRANVSAQHTQRTNAFAFARGDNTTMRPLVKSLWTVVVQNAQKSISAVPRFLKGELAAVFKGALATGGGLETGGMEPRHLSRSPVPGINAYWAYLSLSFSRTSPTMWSH